MEGFFLVLKKVIPFLLGMAVLRRPVAVVAVWAVSLILAQPSFAGLFGPSLPKGEEVEDPYLVQLFAPEFPYESIKVIDTKEGKRYVVIKATKEITRSDRIHYEEKTLVSRGIWIHRSWSPRTHELLVAQMRLYRTVSEEPYVVEFCEVRGSKLKPVLASPCEDVVSYDGRYAIVLLDREFGKVFTRLLVYPTEDLPCPDPPHVGRYPGSRSLGCVQEGQDYKFTYITQDHWKAVYEYYKPKLLRHYKEAGVRLSEDTWGSTFQEGMYRTFGELARMKAVLDLPKPLEKSPLRVSENGVVLNIVLTSIYPQPIVRHFTVVRIRYCTDEGLISDKKRKWKMYPEVSD